MLYSELYNYFYHVLGADAPFFSYVVIELFISFLCLCIALFPFWFVLYIVRRFLR